MIPTHSQLDCASDGFALVLLSGVMCIFPGEKGGLTGDGEASSHVSIRDEPSGQQEKNWDGCPTLAQGTLGGVFDAGVA